MSEFKDFAIGALCLVLAANVLIADLYLAALGRSL